jgi:hypothetical protein
MIRKTQHAKFTRAKSGGLNKGCHTEKHIITTYWLLFIPIYRSYKLDQANI